MAYGITLEFSKSIEVLNSDVVVVAKQNGKALGTLTISKGTIDWRPKHKKAGKGAETQLTWSQFAKLMEETNKA